MKALKRILASALILALCVGAVWALRTRFAPKASAAASSGLTQVVEVKQGNLSTSASVVGELDALQSADMTFSRMSGSAKLMRLEAKPGNTVKAGQLLASIDAAPYQQALDQAKSDLQAAQEKLATLTTPSTKLDISKSDLAVAKAASTLEQAKSALALLQAPDLTTLKNAVRDANDNLALTQLQQTLADHDATTKNERDLVYSVDWHERRIVDLELLVANGQANLEQTNLLAQERLTLGQARTDLARVQASRQLSAQAAIAAVAKAQATLEDAQTALATAQAGGDKLALAKAQVAVQDADVALAVARDNRAQLDQGADPTTLAAAKADVDKKQLAVSDAQADLAATTLVAPFDGTVLQTKAVVGALVGATTQILTVADMKVLQVLASVDETTIRRVTVDQAAQITFDAFPGQVFRGKVLSVPLQGALQGNVMVYEVPVSLTGAEGLSLLVGMTANVQIQMGQVSKALLVPALALQQVNGGYQVLVPNADPLAEPKAVVVQVGLSDGVNTQIVSGLNLGDKVVAKYQTTQTNANQNRNGNALSQLLTRGMSIFRTAGR